MNTLTVICGRLMPMAGEPCARTPGHAGYCRSDYDMGHARDRKRLDYVPLMRDRWRPRRIDPQRTGVGPTG